MVIQFEQPGVKQYGFVKQQEKKWAADYKLNR
jgi:hypothetical protein